MYLDKFKLTGKFAVVTGAGRGIGLAAAEALAEAGATVVLTDMNGDLLATAKAELSAKGYKKVDSEVLDVTDAGRVQAVHDAIMARHGRVDILVNNAGIAISNHPAETMADDVWNKVIDVNLNGVFWCCRAFGKSMLEKGGGSIVNVGSMSGFIVNRPQEQANYNASKAAVHHLTKSLAAEWGARGVRVNSVAPTYIDTEMNKYVYEDAEMYRHWVGGTPMNRLGRTDEVASVILFLASDASSLMTGSIVLADGGYVCW
ncbi:MULTISPECIES: SDR family oxidoreductase [unclassified Rhizobium]|uniref:SDR family NAD(P)-dependent oxidoreductase n=1 Tax=unclassified Rhizobium TaxID=2613769 RepID=UPI001609434C|nr:MULTISPECIES: SDR family oxidoreductase [unclassified Rhizobium]MBB3320006.1 NAD(P)-dependent dehydrogenase (short-subunit alcohol dehydrogenase family) [Rhizobium sp. BK181]MBB3545046.1 NAD(P)-dependent dehydrogenase (short-subunit alcohol dehydrogenase family) [Rhizobium sp. BK399]MCS3743736.1 NAD(P)-dependent dehydrogenase (short-subunit alcohol dehydrogenase family) [Rhizobium sp. BK661]MCS4095717.1 NAD(P)-dependent dehydrogenase (short-subunit alcohol dehydrogenase family) [Rhizobium sp